MDFIDYEGNSFTETSHHSQRHRLLMTNIPYYNRYRMIIWTSAVIITLKVSQKNMVQQQNKMQAAIGAQGHQLLRAKGSLRFICCWTIFF